MHTPVRVSGAGPRRWPRPSWWLGSRLALPVEGVLQAAGFSVLRVQRVNLLGLWRLIELRRDEG